MFSQGTKCYLTNRVQRRNAADLSDVAFDRTNGRWSLACVVGAVVAGLSMSFAAFQACQNTPKYLASLNAFATQVAWTMLRLRITCAVSSVVERLLHTQEVAGSNPASRTPRKSRKSAVLCIFLGTGGGCAYGWQRPRLPKILEIGICTSSYEFHEIDLGRID